MKTQTGFLAGCALVAAGWAMPSAAQADLIVEVIDWGVVASEGEFEGAGAEFTIDVVANPGVSVINFQWVLVFEAFAPSFGSDARIEITAPDMTTFTFSGQAAGWGDAPGFYFDEDSTSAFNGSPLAGEWTFRFYEAFDDGLNPDGRYLASLFVITAIPAPGALALLGLAAFAGRRRRRD